MPLPDVREYRVVGGGIFLDKTMAQDIVYLFDI